MNTSLSNPWFIVSIFLAFSAFLGWSLLGYQIFCTRRKARLIRQLKDAMGVNDAAVSDSFSKMEALLYETSRYPNNPAMRN